uniref:Aminoacyl-transfer RNA synthetases class-II family profile domain-containing protein n=1 Tax=Amphora coffeiformis TaxID=265554 RepID=A0A7S3P4P8_9STRA
MIMIRFISLAVVVTTASAFSTIPRPPDTHSVAHVNGERPTYMPSRVLPSTENLPASSTHRLSRIEIQKAITDVKRFVEARLESDMNLIRHVTPLAFQRGTGVNDVGMDVGQGIYCDSTSIRKGYKGDVTHSAVADQWDYEIRISKEQRSVDQLKSYVKTIWKIITDAEDFILEKYPNILLQGHPTAKMRLPKEITFLTAEELHQMFPDEDVYGRENAAVRKYGAIFIIGMGWPMKDGSAPEEVRSPSYDDWTMNGDIMVLNPITGYRHEISSMGIRVDKDALLKQLEHRGMLHETEYSFQKAVLNDELPYSYGGGIGISRTLMLLLRTAHIGEVQCGLWHDEHYKQVRPLGIDLIPDRIVRE